MDQIQHNFVDVDGLKLRVAEIGSGLITALFPHGFPEIWYSLRHQMIAVAKAEFRAIAPDYRGFGLSQPPPEPAKTSCSDLVSHLVGILDFLSIDKRVSGVATVRAPFIPPAPSVFREHLPEGFYISRWRVLTD